MTRELNPKSTPTTAEPRAATWSLVERRAWKRLSAYEQRQLEAADWQSRPIAVAMHVWEMLSDAQRANLGDDIEAAWHEWGTLGLWMRAHGITNRVTALKSLASRLWTLDHVGEESQALNATDDHRVHPHFDARAGILTLNGQKIRAKVRVMRQPSHIYRILKAFQEADWVGAIDNPLDGAMQTTLHQAVYQLNKGLKTIRFSASGGASTIHWEIAEPTQISDASEVSEIKVSD